MSKLDKIFHKRLERIREELNSYIDSRLTITEHKRSSLAPRGVPEEKKRNGIQDK